VSTDDACLRDYGITDEECLCSRCYQQEEEIRCICDMQLLLSTGCKCGAIEREKEEV
jgi:hypothetical protein